MEEQQKNLLTELKTIQSRTSPTSIRDLQQNEDDTIWRTLQKNLIALKMQEESLSQKTGEVLEFFDAYDLKQVQPKSDDPVLNETASELIISKKDNVQKEKEFLNLTINENELLKQAFYHLEKLSTTKPFSPLLKDFLQESNNPITTETIVNTVKSIDNYITTSACDADFYHHINSCAWIKRYKTLLISIFNKISSNFENPTDYKKMIEETLNTVSNHLDNLVTWSQKNAKNISELVIFKDFKLSKAANSTAESFNLFQRKTEDLQRRMNADQKTYEDNLSIVDMAYYFVFPEEEKKTLPNVNVLDNTKVGPTVFHTYLHTQKNLVDSNTLNTESVKKETLSQDIEREMIKKSSILNLQSIHDVKSQSSVNSTSVTRSNVPKESNIALLTKQLTAKNLTLVSPANPQSTGNIPAATPRRLPLPPNLQEKQPNTPTTENTSTTAKHIPLKRLKESPTNPLIKPPQKRLPSKPNPKNPSALNIDPIKSSETTDTSSPKIVAIHPATKSLYGPEIKPIIFPLHEKTAHASEKPPETTPQKSQDYIKELQEKITHSNTQITHSKQTDTPPPITPRTPRPPSSIISPTITQPALPPLDILKNVGTSKYPGTNNPEKKATLPPVTVTSTPRTTCLVSVKKSPPTISTQHNTNELQEVFKRKGILPTDLEENPKNQPSITSPRPPVDISKTFSVDNPSQPPDRPPPATPREKQDNKNFTMSSYASPRSPNEALSSSQLTEKELQKSAKHLAKTHYSFYKPANTHEQKATDEVAKLKKAIEIIYGSSPTNITIDHYKAISITFPVNKLLNNITSNVININKNEFEIYLNKDPKSLSSHSQNSYAFYGNNLYYIQGNNQPFICLGTITYPQNFATLIHSSKILTKSNDDKLTLKTNILNGLIKQSFSSSFSSSLLSFEIPQELVNTLRNNPQTRDLKINLRKLYTELAADKVNLDEIFLKELDDVTNNLYRSSIGINNK